MKCFTVPNKSDLYYCDQVIDNLSQLTIDTGVYAVYHGHDKCAERCLYVGASTELKTRLKHVLQSSGASNIYLRIILKWFKENKPNYKVYVRIFKCLPSELEINELGYIELLRPMTNAKHNQRFNKANRFKANQSITGEE